MAEIRGAQTNTKEQANAPKESGEQQAAQSTIAEGSAGQGNARQQPQEAATDAGKAAAPAEPAQPAASSTQAAGGVKTPADQPRADRDRTPAEKADAAKA